MEQTKEEVEAERDALAIQLMELREVALHACETAAASWDHVDAISKLYGAARGLDLDKSRWFAVEVTLGPLPDDFDAAPLIELVTGMVEQLQLPDGVEPYIETVYRTPEWSSST